MRILIILIVFSLAMACGGSKTPVDSRESASAFKAILSEGEIIGYNFTKDDGEVIFVPLDDMPPAAPVGLE